MGFQKQDDGQLAGGGGKLGRDDRFGKIRKGEEKVGGGDVYGAPMGGKEKEMAIAKEGQDMEEVRKEIELSKEEEEAGVETIRETIDLPERVKEDTGIKEVGEGVSVSDDSGVLLPLDDGQIKKAKKKSVVDSITWLAWWCLRQIQLIGKKREEKADGSG